MSTQPKHYITPEEYLELDSKAEFRSEYFAGEMFAMSGGTRRHSVIAVNIASRLREHLRGGPCDVYQSDMRIRTSATGLYTYSDVSVSSSPQFADDKQCVLVNPVLIVEVLSPSTEAYDRGEKFDHYRKNSCSSGISAGVIRADWSRTEAAGAGRHLDDEICGPAGERD